MQRDLPIRKSWRPFFGACTIFASANMLVACEVLSGLADLEVSVVASPSQGDGGSSTLPDGAAGKDGEHGEEGGTTIADGATSPADAGTGSSDSAASDAVSADTGSPPLDPVTLSVEAISLASGSGFITSNPVGINCVAKAGDAGCAASFERQTQVRIAANPGAQSHLGAWGGPCAGTVGALCDVVMTAAEHVTVEFVRD